MEGFFWGLWYPYDRVSTMTERWHGTTGGYSNHKCRCDPCRLAWNAYCAERKRKARRNFTPAPGDEHGLEKTYQKGCKCALCLAGHSRYRSRHMKAGREPKEGFCDICKLARRVFWDHDHASGSHRGWLCTKCNQGLGLFNDNIESMQRAVNYLEG